MSGLLRPNSHYIGFDLPMFGEIPAHRTEQRAKFLREYRTRLIADVVTGKLDVRGVELTTLDDDDTLVKWDEVDALDEWPEGDTRRPDDETG